MFTRKMKKWMGREGGPIDQFTHREKLVMRMSYAAMILTALSALFLHNRFLGIFYIFILILCHGYFMYALCANCPYPYIYKDCLFFPSFIMAKWVPRRSGVVKKEENRYMAVAVAVMLLYPQIWLLKHLFLFVLFWLFALPVVIYTSRVMCKECRHKGCPLNKAVKSE